MEGFLSHQKLRYLKISLGAMALSIVLFLLHQPQQEPNGGTWLGYGLGTIGAILIFWLMYYGKRKRDYLSTNGTMRGWLSAHVYLGSALLIIATLHTGFQFGFNVHTLAYLLMCLAIFSGFYGAWAYIYMPLKKRENLDGRTLDEHFRDIEDIDKIIRKTAEGLPGEITALISSAIDRTELGGELFDQLSIRDKSKVIIDGKLQPNADQKTVISKLITKLSGGQDSEKVAQLKQLIELFGKRKNLLFKVRYDIKVSALLKLWVFVHVPVSAALIAALFVHVLTVFLYW